MEVNRYSGVSGIRGKLVKCLSRNDVGSEMLFCGNQHVLGNMRTAFATFLMVSCTIRPSPHVDIPLPDGHRTICGETKYEWCREEYSSKNRLKHGRLGSKAGYDRSGLRLWRKTFSPCNVFIYPCSVRTGFVMGSETKYNHPKCAPTLVHGILLVHSLSTVHDMLHKFRLNAVPGLLPSSTGIRRH